MKVLISCQYIIIIICFLQGFFKRSLPKADKYKCFFGGQCQLSPQNRNRCKACRFKKCQDMGMSVDGKFILIFCSQH